MLTTRQGQLLKTIIAQYIQTAQPVSSEWLADNFKFSSNRTASGGKKLSPATIRNEMMVLLEKGFLFQPHTSAGRLPTEKAYHYYIKNFLQETKVQQTDIKKINQLKNKKGRGVAKELGQTMSELTGDLALVAFDKNNFYYTGLSRLFSQPEFINSTEVMYNLGQIFDRLDQIVANVFDEVEDEPKIWVGRENPFGEFCSTILTRLEIPESKQNVVFGLLGPLRMDYDQNLGLINYLRKMLNK